VQVEADGLVSVGGLPITPDPERVRLELGYDARLYGPYVLD